MAQAVQCYAWSAEDARCAGLDCYSRPDGLAPGHADVGIVLRAEAAEFCCEGRVARVCKPFATLVSGESVTALGVTS